MTIYPFKIPLPFFPHELTGYGLMMMVAFLMGGWLVTLELRRRPPSIFDYAFEDREVIGYQHHPAIRAPVAV